MSVTRATLIARFPEFASTPEALVTSSIADAELMIDRPYFGSKADVAVTLYASHLIAINPLGEMARLDKKGEETTYLIAFERVKRSIGVGCRVI